MAIPRGISNLQGTLNGNILHFTIDHSQGISIWEVSFWPRNKSRFYSTIKTPSPQKIGMHNSPEL